MGEAKQRGSFEDRKAQAEELANEDCEVMIFLSVPKGEAGGVNVKMLPRDEEPNQDSPAVILASYLNSNMADLVTEAMMAWRGWKEREAAKARGEDPDALRLAEAPSRSILNADGSIARRTDDVNLILPPGARCEEPAAESGPVAVVSGQGGEFSGGGASGSFESAASESSPSSSDSSPSGGD